MSTKRWQDQLILILGVWLFVSPWALSYQSGTNESLNAYIAGAAIALLAAFDLYKTYFWAVVVNLLIGIWTAVSPWVMGVAGEMAVTANSLVVGLAVAVLALWEMRTDPELYDQWHGKAAT